MREEWGPWVEHDGGGCPVRIGMVICVVHRDGKEQSGRVTMDIMLSPNWFFAAPELMGETDVIRYRIRNPKGLQELQDLIADLPVPTPQRQPELV
ncbi:hypothetical protein [Salipiger abyssi]|nr:hypothetical protein [Salipiger abyssi]